MAAIASIGRSAPKRVRVLTEAAIDAVIERMVHFGLRSEITLHGSAATGDYAFLDIADGPALMSDVDIIVADRQAAPHIPYLQNELSKVFQFALGPLATPASQVSIKVPTGAFLRAPEAASLLQSAIVNGRGVDRRQANPLTGTARVTFPYALPYALWRAACHLGGGPTSNAVALYELCKGCWRTRYPIADNHSRGAQIFSVKECQNVLEASRFSVRSVLRASHSRLFANWLATSDLLSADLCETSLLAQRAQIGCVVSRTVPDSLLSARVESEATAGVAA